ncbi:hypothetical protein OSTOST_16626, partial [Ostertagia ostertagi]
MSRKDDQIYDSMLLNGAEKADGLDSFFVTQPPLRTTVPAKYSVVDSPAPSESLSDLVQPEVKSTTRYRAPLRLVTIPPTSSTPLAPFKHHLHCQWRKVFSGTVADGCSATIPTHPASSSLISQDSTQIPPNPFLPITPASELNVTYPFIPIGTSDSRPPPFSPPQMTPFNPPQGQQRIIH